MAAIVFFQTKNLLKDLRYQLKIFKFTLDTGLTFAKKIPALVNLQVTNINGTNYVQQKEESMPKKLPET